MVHPTERILTHAHLSSKISQLSDEQLLTMIEQGAPFHSGTGGSSVVIKLDGTPIFIKRIPLTTLELESGNYLSTANVFNLPIFFQYGVGSPGFGAWRELKTHEFANEWVLSGQCPHFPLMYHWRELPLPSIGSEEEQIQKAELRIAYWEGSSPVRRRYEELQRATRCIAVFLEYFPNTLGEWIETQLQKGEESASHALLSVQAQLDSVTHFLVQNDFLHFDAHFRNILTDGESLYFTDFGLAITSEFALSSVELAFFKRHHLYDFGMNSTGLVHSLLTHFYGMDAWGPGMENLIKRAQDEQPKELAGLLVKHAPAALVMADFFRKLRNHSKQVPFPHEELERALDA